MLKSILVPVGAVTLIVTAGLVPQIHGHGAPAQSAPLYVNAVDFDVNPDHYTEFMTAAVEDGADSIKEAGVREFDVMVSQNDPNHVFIFEAFDNAAAWDAHQKSARYAKFITTTMTMVKKYDFRSFSSIAMHTNNTAISGPFFIAADYLDITPANIDKFLDAAKDNAAASVKDPGCREFNIAVSQQHPNQVLFFEVYYNAAAFAAYQSTDHFKKFQATTAGMIVKRDDKKLWAKAMNLKGM